MSTKKISTAALVQELDKRIAQAHAAQLERYARECGGQVPRWETKGSWGASLSVVYYSPTSGARLGSLFVGVPEVVVSDSIPF